MRILACSYRYLPDIGGIETSTAVLAAQWASRGHDVTIVSRTPGEATVDGIDVIRSPGVSEFLNLVRHADIVWQNNPSLPWLVQARCLDTPILVTHQTWLTQPDGSVGTRERVKSQALRGIPQIAISRAIAQRAPGCRWIIPNPFDPKFGTCRKSADGRPIDIAFVGRMVSDKGVSLMLAALTLLEKRGIKPTVAFVGDGPEKHVVDEWIQSDASRRTRVVCRGALPPAAVAEVLGTSRILAVPSLWEEPFGIVALEGIAAGCSVVASDGGGLPEAVGPCGLLARRGDTADFADKLAQALESDSPSEAARQNHLARFAADRIADDYLELFGSYCGKETRP